MSRIDRSLFLCLFLLFAGFLSACGGAFDEKVAVPAEGGGGTTVEADEPDAGGDTTAPTTVPAAPTTVAATTVVPETVEIAPEELAQLRKVVEVVVDDVAPAADADQCVLDGLVQNPDLVEAALQLEINQSVAAIPLESQLALYRLLVDCAGPELVGSEVGAGFAEGAELEVAPGELSECFGAELSGPDGPLVIAGLVAVGEELAPPPESREPLVNTLSTCVPAKLLIDFAVAELADDVTFTDALDLGCVDSSYTGEVSTAGMWEAFLDNPELEFTELDPEVTSGIFGPLFDCISLGTVIAAEAAADGIDLSAATVDCLDAEFAELDIFAKFLAGEEPDDAVLGAAVLSCLSPEELLALGG